MSGTALTRRPPNRSPRTAVALTEVFAPAHLVIALPPLVGWHATRSVGGLAWGVVAAVVCGVLPYGWLLAATRRGRIGDRHVRLRRQRFAPLGVAGVCVVAGVVLVGVGGAPRQVSALLLAMLAGLVATVAVTLMWKISVHTAVAAGSLAVLVAEFGLLLLAAVPVLAAVAWSRVVLRHHTPAQAAAGVLLGAATATAVYLPLR